MKKGNAVAKVIPADLTEEQKNKWTEILTDYYKNLGKLTEDEIKDKISQVLTDCVTGWPNAPNTLESRISLKTGYKSKLLSNLSARKTFVKKKEEEAKLVETLQTGSKKFSNLDEALTDEEKKWWGQRLNEYRGEFEFNVSSDMVLLNQLLVEELLQRRIFFQQLKRNEALGLEASRVLTESNKRIQDLQTKLGITRDQRVGILNQIDGNVANISVKLEEKLKEYGESFTKEVEDEIYYKTLQQQRPPNNILPSTEQIEAILSGSGDVFEQKELDRSKMDVEQPDLKKDKKEPTEELPSGIVL